jgi:hypothetical protein
MIRMARRPAMKISTDRTPAKMGRSMKNLDGFILVTGAKPAPGWLGSGIDL